MCVDCWYIHVYVCRLLVYTCVCVLIAGIYTCMPVDCWYIHVYVCRLLRQSTKRHEFERMRISYHIYKICLIQYDSP